MAWCTTPTTRHTFLLRFLSVSERKSPVQPPHSDLSRVLGSGALSTDRKNPNLLLACFCHIDVLKSAIHCGYIWTCSKVVKCPSIERLKRVLVLAVLILASVESSGHWCHG